MSSRSAALPVERSYLFKAWLVVVAIVVIAVTVVTLALATSGTAPAGGTSPRNPPSVSDVEDPHEPIVVNGMVCRQCR